MSSVQGQVVVFFTACFLVTMSTTVQGQLLGGPKPQTTAPKREGVLSAFRTIFGIQTFAGGNVDTGFDWESDLSVDFDMVDFGLVRINTFGSIETVIGSEFRPVDPNQNNYTVDFTVFLRLPRGELAAMFHHVSRHLVDRPRRRGVSWNMVGLAYGDRFSVRGVSIDAWVRGMGTVGRAGVDYKGQIEAHVNAVRPISARVSLIAGGYGVIVPVQSEIFGRTQRQGGRIESGFRWKAGVAALDVFASWERRIDWVTIATTSAHWAQLGFRLMAPVP